MLKNHPPPSIAALDRSNPLAIKAMLNDFHHWSMDAFIAGMDVEQLLRHRSDYIDQLLSTLWKAFAFNSKTTNPLTLLAVGGYGRRELHPLSDIDLLIVCETPLNSGQEQKISEFIALLWDLKLEVGHSVRTLQECLAEAQADITVMTNAMESRLIVGDANLLYALHHGLFAGNIWPSALFFQAKVQEQQARHLRYNSTSYNLEPDIKNGPGGLRDIHTIQWIALRQFGSVTLDDMVKFGFLTPAELLELKQCRHFLWRMRFALHLDLTRHDNRLLFDRQINVAQRLGYQREKNHHAENQSSHHAVERMMKDFYRVLQNINELNEMLLQLFEQTVLNSQQVSVAQSLDEHFQLRDHQIELKDNALFMQQPMMMMQMFYWLATHPDIQHISPNTLRQLRYARRHLTGHLCDIPQARALFMLILRHPNAIKGALLPMHKHGILSAYLPNWHNITGLMQFDLFHAYTVDEHTIRVLLKIASFADPESRSHHPLCVDIYPALAKPELLLIAALFHDIAKGRGGDHSQLGALDVAAFCKLHELREKDTQLVIWLVKNHLLMSMTAQGRDIQDPAMIKYFATDVESLVRLQYLLCLTVADICATNPKLWNSWKQSLLRELYLATEKQFDRGMHNLPDQRSIARQNRQDALALLQSAGISEQVIEPIWQQCRVDYFLRHSPNQLAWHAAHLVQHTRDQPLILINPHAYRGGTEIFIYAPDRPFLFAAVSGELDARNLNILAAHIFTNKQGMAMDTFIVLEPEGKIVAADRHDAIRQSLLRVLNQLDYCPPRRRRSLSTLRHFMLPTEVNFITTQTDKKTYLELIALDRPGLLARIGEVFANLNLSLHSARIATIGERVEDFFVLTDQHRQALDAMTRQLLQQQLIDAINSMDS